MPEPGPPEPTDREGAVSSEVSGYVRFIDINRLVFLAKSYGVIVRVVRRVGHFVPAGVPLLIVSKGERLTPGRSAELRGAFDLGPTRTLQQDIEFGILQIVDIALRAISPAVNDPSTAINCVDQLSRILIRFASRDEAASLRYDPPGTLRVTIPWPGFDRLVDAAFDQIRLYSTADVVVSLRMLRALGDIATTVPDPDVQQTLAERGRQIVAGCAEELAEEDLRKLRLRLSALERLGISPESPVNAREQLRLPSGFQGRCGRSPDRRSQGRDTAMNDAFQQRIRAAAIAGWWTVLIAVGFLTLVWMLFLVLMSARPPWYQSLLGPGVSWEYIQNVGFWAVAIFKMCIWLMALVVVWLTLWSRQLGKRSE